MISGICDRGVLRWAVFLSVMICGTAVTGFATTVVPPDFAELVNESDYIVRAVVKSITAEERRSTTGKNLIYSRVELEVKQVVAGKVPSPVVLVVLGGKIGERELAIEGVPKFAIDEEAVFFVQGNGTQIYPLVRMMHGLYPIKKDTIRGREYMVRSDGDLLRDVKEISRSADYGHSAIAQPSSPMIQALSPEDFILKIRAAAVKSNLCEY